MFVPAVQYAGLSNRPGASRGQLRAAARPQRSLSQSRPLPLQNDRGSFPGQCDAGDNRTGPRLCAQFRELVG